MLGRSVRDSGALMDFCLASRAAHTASSREWRQAKALSIITRSMRSMPFSAKLSTPAEI